MYRLSCITSTRANRKKQFRKQNFKLGWRYVSQEEIAANMYSSREVDRIGKLCVVFLNDYVRGNQLGKVVHGDFRKDFLVDVLHLFCVEVDETKGVFELAEGSFNSPASGVEESELSGRESDYSHDHQLDRTIKEEDGPGSSGRRKNVGVAKPKG